MAEETVGRVAVEVVPKADNFEADAKKQIQPQLESLLKGLAAGVAAKKIFDFGKDSFKAFDEAQKVGKQTEAVLKSTGNAAGITADEIEKLATSISKKTSVDDEAIQSGANLLLTFKDIKNEAGEGNDIFNQTTAIMVDMAAAMGTDAAGSAIQLGKALNDPTQGLTALTRVGVSFTDAQKEQIKTMQDAGDIAGAQKLILAELTSEFGGSAAAQATASDRMKLAFDNLQEEIGGQLAPAVEKALNLVSGLTEGFGGLPGPMQSVVLVAGGVGAGLFAVGKIMDTIHATSTSLEPVFKALSSALTTTGVDGSKALSGLGKAFVGLGAAASAVSIALFVKSVHDNAQQLNLDVRKIAGGTEEAFASLAAGLLRLQEIDPGGVTREFTKTADENIDAARRLRDAIGDTGASTEKYDRIIEESIAASQRRVISEDKGAAALKETGKIADVTKDQLSDYTKIMEENSKAVDDAGEPYRDWIDSLTDADTAVNNLMNRLFGLTDADAEWNIAFEKATETLGKNGKTLDVWTESGRENRDVLKDMTTKAGEWLGKIFEQEGASQNFQETSKRIRDEITETARKAGISQKDLQPYLDALNSLQGNFEANVNFTATGDWDIILRVTDRFGSNLGAETNKAGASFGAKGGNFRPEIPRYEWGGMNLGGLGIVGERGAELIKFGGTTAVFPHNQLEDSLRRAMKGLGGAGPSTTVNVFVDNVSHGDARDVGATVGESVLRTLVGTNIGVATRQGAGG